MSSRRRRNSIPFFFVNGVLVEVVQNVRNAMLTYFSSHFQTRHVQRPRMDTLNFRTLSYREGVVLIKPFSMEEVKARVWDCGNFKCPDPDGVNLGFIKDLWYILKDDVMHFLSEFHRNGRLTKGINSTICWNFWRKLNYEEVGVG